MGGEKGLDAFCVIWADAPTQEERCMPLIMRQHFPVEFLAIATYGLAFCVEEEIVHKAFVGFGLFQVLCRCNVEGFDDGRVTGEG